MNMDLLFKKGYEAGLSDMEVYLVKDENFSCKVFEQAVDTYSVSVTQGLSFRGAYEGNMGYTYTEKCDDSSIEFLIDSVIQNASILEKDEKEVLYAGDPSYVELELYQPTFNDVSALEKINFLKEVEAACLAMDTRVKSVNYCLFANGTSEVTLQNTKGLNLSQKQNYGYAYVSVLVTENGENKTEGDYIVSSDFKAYKPQAFAKRIVSQAVAQLGAQKVKSGAYPILLKNVVAGSILDAMSDSFSAEQVHKELSRLKGKINKKVASSLLTLVDDPHLKDGLGSTSFDGEGVATYPKEVITDGVLNTYLHSLTTAKTFNAKPTGNASRGSFKSPINISPTNMYIKPTEVTVDHLMATIDDGIYISDVQGLHSGLNAISGDFSLSASGFRIEKGKISTPLHEMTIAGNFFDLLHTIKGIGEDLDFGASSIGSPSLWVDSLAVAGE